MKTEDIKTISAYRCVGDLLEAETVLPELSEDFRTYLFTFDAFDSLEYFCANGKTVIVTDSCNGDVLEICELSDILPEIMVQAEEDGIAV